VNQLLFDSTDAPLPLQLPDAELDWQPQYFSAQRADELLLLNWYRDGNDSVSWHSDDEPELGADPVIASLSLGQTRRFELRHRQRKDLRKCVLELNHGSLLLMGKGLQRNWQHQIPKQPGLQGERLNLTFRFIA
jgi:alkylated DNA repair dioxygenase AlkB